MTKQTSQHESKGFSRRLKRLVARSPSERVRVEISKVSAAIVKAKENESLLCDAAFILSAAIHKEADINLREFYLNELAQFGAMAPALIALALVTEIEEDPKSVRLFKALPLEMQLDISNLVLGDNHRLYEPLRQMALNQMDSVLAMDEDTARSFLVRSAKHGTGIAYVMQEALLSGPFGVHVHKAVQNAEALVAKQERPPKEFSAQAELLGTLQNSKAATELLPVLKTKHAPTLIAALRTIRQSSPKKDSALVDAATKAGGHPDLRVKGEALTTLTATGADNLGAIFAAQCKGKETSRQLALAVAPLLPPEEFQSFCKHLGDDAPQALEELFFTLAQLDPAGITTQLEHSPNKSLAALLPAPPSVSKEFDVKLAAKAFAPKTTTSAKKKTRAPILGRLKGSKGISIQFGDDQDSASEHAGKTLSPNYENRKLKSVDFSGAFLKGAVFKNCTFEGANFSGALLQNCRFQDCQLIRCDFSQAKIFNTTFSYTTFEHGSMNGTIVGDCRFRALALSGSDLRDIQVHTTSMTTVRLMACDCSGLGFSDSTMTGAEFILSRFARAIFYNVRFMNMIMAASTLPDAAFSGLITDSPRLLLLEHQALTRQALQIGTHAPLAASGNKKLPQKALRAVLNRWFEFQGLKQRMTAFRENNRRRVTWCCAKLGHKREEFYRLAPLLLHSEIFEAHMDDLTPMPLSCRMAGYEPSYTTLELAKKHFPNATLPADAPDPILFEGLFTIGSTGTVAQTPASDLDYWVCYDSEDIPSFMLQGLANKLESIERWADQTFGLEVHFFPMDVSRIQNNQFGFSDSESSGSAQALLLKEEFYRTAMRVAGKVPLWWMTMPGAGDAQYKAIRDDIQQSPLGIDCLDMGNLVDIPPSEFFGASLWQIVKALKSPFKSIMKFGLLEKYIATLGSGESPLLCDRIKAALCQGDTALENIDPYMLLYREVSEHYKQAGELDSLALVRLSFFLKIHSRDLHAATSVALRREDQEIRTLLDALEAQGDGVSPSRDWSFERLEKVGRQVNNFVVRTYMRVRESQAKHKEVTITPEDLTKLGRKISSTFSKRDNKVVHVPFLSIGGNPFTILHVAASGKKIGKPTTWDIQGAQQVTGKNRLQLVNLRRDTNLPSALTWMVANGLYRPGIELRGDYSISPVTARDIETLLEKLHAFFPPATTFDTDIGEMLKRECVVRAYLILNLVSPREKRALDEATVVYATNWGELFCQPLPSKTTGLLTDPIQFLRQHLEPAFSTKLHLGAFVPERSHCPRPTI